ncbi:Cellulose synthase, partial [Cynara cardunculus var. scolymus]
MDLSSYWFLPSAYVFVGKYAYNLGEFYWIGGTLKGWWSDQRMWLYRRLTCYLFAFLDVVLKSMGFTNINSILTSKGADEDAFLDVVLKYLRQDGSDNDSDSSSSDDDDVSDAPSLDHISEVTQEYIGEEQYNVREEDLMAFEYEKFLNGLNGELKRDNIVETNINNDDAEHDLAQEGGKYPMHNPKTHWKIMKPILGERYERPTQLKECITTY